MSWPDMKPVNRNLYRNIHKKGVTFRSSQDPAEIRCCWSSCT